MCTIMKMIKCVVLFFVFLVVMSSLTTARPSHGSSLNSVDACRIDSKIQDTCQYCAKMTKSNVVYPMCCANEDEVYTWCEKYINFGIH